MNIVPIAWQKFGKDLLVHSTVSSFNILHVAAEFGLSFLAGFLGVFSAHYERNGTQNLEFTFTDTTRDHVDANLFIAQLGRERVITFRLYIVSSDWFCLYCCKVIMSSFKNNNMQDTKIAVV